MHAATTASPQPRRHGQARRRWGGAVLSIPRGGAVGAAQGGQQAAVLPGAAPIQACPAGPRGPQPAPPSRTAAPRIAAPVPIPRGGHPAVPLRAADGTPGEAPSVQLNIAPNSNFFSSFIFFEGDANIGWRCGEGGGLRRGWGAVLPVLPAAAPPPPPRRGSAAPRGRHHMWRYGKATSTQSSTSASEQLRRCPASSRP